MDEETNDLIDDTLKAYLAQMDSAMKITKIVSEHGNEEELTADSVITGLVYRLMIPMTDKDMKDSLDEADRIINEEYDLPTPDIDSYDEKENVVISRNVKRNNCNCEICMNARVCLSNYHLHVPSDNLSQIFKDAIDNACIIHKINI